MFSCAKFRRLQDLLVSGLNATLSIVALGSMLTTIDSPGVGASCAARVPAARQSRFSIALQPLLGVLLLIGAGSLQAQSVTATVTVGPCPNALAVDPVTDTVYVTSVVNTICSGNNAVTVINGSSNATNTIISDGTTTLLNPLAIAIDPTTDLVYVTDDDSPDGSITLINGATNAASEIAPTTKTSVPSGVVVNPVTNTIYVMSLEEGGSLANGAVTVINGSTGAITATIPVGATPIQIAINTVTNKIYVLNYSDNTVTVIDGATNAFSTVPIGPGVTGVNVGSLPVSMAINTTTNKIYIGGAFESLSTTTLAESFQMLVIDGATNAVSAITVSSSPTSLGPLYPAEYLAVDATTNMVYGTTGTDPDAGEVMAYNAVTGAITWIAAGTKPTALAVDEGTDTIYVANEGSNNVTVINGSTKGATTVNVGAYPTAVAVNPSTHTAYVLNADDGTVSVIGGASTAAATTTTLTSDANPTTAGTNVTFTAYVAETSGSTIPTGNVTFSVDGLSVSTTALDSTGHATYSTSSLTAGTHTVAVSYAGATGFATSSSSTLTETIGGPVASSPAFSPAAGTYAAAQSVTISDATNGAIVYYTTNGTTPTTSSTRYTGAIAVSTSETLEAIAVASGYTNSTVASADYVITTQVATPGFSPGPGSYTSAQTVTISDSTVGAAIYYTTNGTRPTTSSSLYSGPITVNSSETIEAMAVAIGYTNSAVAAASYTINPATPDFGISLSPTALTVTAGSSGTETITITPQNGFNSAVSFGCSGLPSGASCSFSPATVTPAGAAATTTLTISTSATSAEAGHGSGPFMPGATLAAALCCLGFRRRRWMQMFLLLAGVTLGLTSLAACGGSSSTVHTSSTSAVTVTATAGSLEHGATLTLTQN